MRHRRLHDGLAGAGQDRTERENRQAVAAEPLQFAPEPGPLGRRDRRLCDEIGEGDEMRQPAQSEIALEHVQMSEQAVAHARKLPEAVGHAERGQQ
jgi:hypothetical protein